MEIGLGIAAERQGKSPEECQHPSKHQNNADITHCEMESECKPSHETQPTLHAIIEKLRLIFHLADDRWDSKSERPLDLWLIHPESLFRLYWDTIVIITLGVILVILPVSIAFNYNDNGHTWITFYAVTDAIFCLDILMNFRTGIYVKYEQCQLLGTSKSVAQRYARTWLPTDFLGVLPIHYILGALAEEKGTDYAHGNIVYVFRLPKLLELAKLLHFSRAHRYFASWSEMLSATGSAIGYVKLLAAMFLLCHWNACLTFLVPALYNFPENCWVKLGSLQDKDWFEIYTHGLYKTVSNMITTGYGAYSPYTTPEIMVMIWCLLSECLLMSLFTGYTIQTINKYNFSEKAFQSRMLEVQDYILARRLPRKLERKIKDYYEQRFRGKLFDEQVIFGEMSEVLKLEILNQTSRHIISSVAIFRSAEPNFINDMVCALRQEMFQQGDVIIKAGHRTALKMYFVKEGALEILSKNKSFLKTIQSGCYFGEIGMLTNLPRTATVRAVTNVKLLSLTREKFQAIFRDYPLMRKALIIIASKRLHSLVEDVHIDRDTLFMQLHALHAQLSECVQT